MKFWQILLILFAMNLLSFLLFGIDKHRAKKNHWRISEFTLLLSAFAMGGVGAFMGMKVWRHKTQKTKFKILVPLAIICNLGILIYIFGFLKWKILF